MKGGDCVVYSRGGVFRLVGLIYRNKEGARGREMYSVGRLRGRIRGSWSGRL